MKEKIYDARTGMEYVLVGDYYLPALKLPRTRPIGRWGMLHKAYLKLRKPAYYQSLLLSGKLDTVLANVEEQAVEGLYRSLGSIDVVAAARSVLQVERDTENPDIRIVHQIKNSLAPTAEDIRFSISADKGFRWLECRPQLFEKQQPDAEPKFDTEQQKAAYWIKHFLEKGDMSANEIYCRLDNEGVSKRVARMVKTEMGIHCYQKKRRWYWSVQLEEGAMNGPQV